MMTAAEGFETLLKAMTDKDVKNAELNVISAEYDLKTTMLEGLSLERDLKIFAL